MKAYYLGEWHSQADMMEDFWPRIYRTDGIEYKDELVHSTVLLASYERESYEGTAFVLILRWEFDSDGERVGKLYEVNASHCSCYGLEGQWNEEETTKEALLYRMNEGKLGWDWGGEKSLFANELKLVLAEI